MIAELFALAVTAQGHEVLVCHDGRHAIDRVEDWAPTAAIIDIGVPGVTGYGVAQHMRGLARIRPVGPQALLIALTGYDSPADIAMARYAGFNWHFAKPARPTRVLATLENPARAPLGKGDGTPLDRAVEGDRRQALQEWAARRTEAPRRRGPAALSGPWDLDLFPESAK
jgi:CheY-like chemotaxis protein